MKTTSHLAAVKAVAIATCVIASALPSHAVKRPKGTQPANQPLMPTNPAGWLSAYPTIVRTGTKPTLTWSIAYPSTINNYVTVAASETVTTLDQLDVTIRVIGSGVTTGSSSGTNTSWVPAQALLSVNGGTFLSVFYGTNLQVSPDALVWAKRVNKGTTFRFGGRYYANNAWSTAYYSNENDNNIRVLKNGEFPPTAFALHTSSALKGFMTPYLDGEGRIKIGPLDLIIMMELTQTEANFNSPFYNLQDLVLLMTCQPRSNNGHGNNIDGVDSSNPGESRQIDPSGAVDDERRR